jgi:hypothetical protein
MIPPMSEPDILGNTASHFIAAMDELVAGRAQVERLNDEVAHCIGRVTAAEADRDALLDQVEAVRALATGWASLIDKGTELVEIRVRRGVKRRAGQAILAILDAPSAAEPDPLSVACSVCWSPPYLNCSIESHDHERKDPHPERTADARKDTP